MGNLDGWTFANRVGKTVPFYVVYDENTLGYRMPGRKHDLGVLHGNLQGHDWKNGYIHVMDLENIRPATKRDFANFRVVLPPNFGSTVKI